MEMIESGHKDELMKIKKNIVYNDNDGCESFESDGIQKLIKNYIKIFKML